MIALLCSVPKEAELLRTSLRVYESEIIGFKAFVRGELFGQQVALCTGGMSKANAAHSASILITRYSPSALIIFGIGGAYPSCGIKIGDVVVASEEIDADTGIITHEGFHEAHHIGVPLIQTDKASFFNRLPASEQLFAYATRILSASTELGRVYTGPFVTVSSCTGTSKRARELELRYRGICENMEGVSAAHVAELHRTPWMEVRGISNIVEDRDLKKWNTPLAARSAQRAIQLLLEHWDLCLESSPSDTHPVRTTPLSSPDSPAEK